MEKQLPRTSILSLQEMALRKVAILLWNEPRTLVLVGNYRYRPRYRWEFDKFHWCRTVESEVSVKIPELLLPKVLEKKMVRILGPIGLQILRWKVYHEAYLHDSYKCFDVPILEKLLWTAAGAVDYLRTAEELVRSDVLDSVERYKLACLYCLDHYIPEIWRELPSAEKMWFYDDEDLSRVIVRLPHFYWPYILKGEENKLNRWTEDSIAFNRFAFQLSSSQGNKAAAKYFLQKLSPEEKEASLVSTADEVLWSRNTLVNGFPFQTAEQKADALFPDSNISDVVFYLLSEMTPEQQIRIFKERPAEVLGCFTDWPWQDALSDSADAMWTWMQCEDVESRVYNYDVLLDTLRRSLHYSDYCFPSLFQNFFLHSPSDFKKRFVAAECEKYYFLTEFFEAEDTGTISVVLGNVDEGDRVRLVSSDKISNPFLDSISGGDVAEKCLRETGLSEEGKKCLKEAFMKLRVDSKIPKWRRFFEFLDETDGKGKRSSDAETSSESKKKKTAMLKSKFQLGN